MTKTIHKLPNDLINKIAAGEVVERPSSIVKELLENSIDAGSTEVNIELENGGIQLIKIIDNGKGVHQDDFPQLFERHATSKISSLQELEQNLHLGFRGEALASISSVSHTIFASFPKDAKSGTQIDSSGEIKPVSMPHGTQVEINDLFYNVPARKKYLKTENTEYKKCLQLIEQYCLAHPEVHFSLSHNQKVIFDYSSTDKAGRIRQIFGSEFSEKLLPVFFQGNEVFIEGFVGKPELAKQKSPHQFFLINGRPIKTPAFNYAVKQAFGSLIFPQEKPQFFLWININPEDVDMNVHPRKIEARFHYEGVLFRHILRSVKHALEKTDLTKQIEIPKQNYNSFISKPAPSPSFSSPNPAPQSFNLGPSSYKPSNSKKSLTNYFQENHQRNTQTLNNSYTSNPEPQSKPKLYPLAQIENSYILCQGESSLVIIDQHAAHERILYEQFKAEALSQSPKSQKLLTPIQIQLTPKETKTLEEAQETLTKIGFDITILGQDSIGIQGLPAKFTKTNLEELIKDLLDDIQNNDSFQNLSDLEDIVINYAACRGAIKFGQPLTRDEMIALIQEMEKIEHKQYSCPHGRPSKVEITFKQLEKQFKRIK